MARKRSKTPKRRGPRASWRGMLRFGLVSFAVEAVNAHSKTGSDIAFHQLHDKCHSRIHYQKVCPIHGPVENDEIVSGYETSKGHYVEIEPEELDALRSEAERALTLDTFVDVDVIDPIYFDGRMYFLVPAGAESREPYSIFREALERKQRWGVGQVVFSGKEQLVVVRPYENALHMAMLNYVPEMRDAEDVVGEVAAVRRTDKTLKLAEQLIESASEADFDLSDYVDDYREQVEKLIAAKRKGEEIVTPEVEDEPEVINLMDALKKSVAQSKSGQRKRKSSRSRKSSGRRSRRRAS